MIAEIVGLVKDHRLPALRLDHATRHIGIGGHHDFMFRPDLSAPVAPQLHPQHCGVTRKGIVDDAVTLGDNQNRLDGGQGKGALDRGHLAHWSHRTLDFLGLGNRSRRDGDFHHRLASACAAEDRKVPATRQRIQRPVDLLNLVGSQDFSLRRDQLGGVVGLVGPAGGEVPSRLDDLLGRSRRGLSRPPLLSGCVKKPAKLKLSITTDDLFGWLGLGFS